MTLECLRAEPIPADGRQRVLEALRLDDVSALQRVRGRLRRAAVRLATTLLLSVLGLSGWIVRQDRAPKLHMRPVVLPSPNAYTYFRDSARLMQVPDAVMKVACDWPRVEAANRYRIFGLVPRVIVEPPTTPDRVSRIAPSERKALLLANAEALRLLRTGLRHEYREPPVLSFDAPSDHYRGYLHLAYLLVAEAQDRARRGDMEGALESSLDAIRLGTLVARGAPMVGWHVAAKCRAIGRAALWEIMDSLSRDQMLRAAKELQTLHASETSILEALENEEEAGVAALIDFTGHHSWRWTIPRLSRGAKSEESASEKALWFVLTIQHSRSDMVKRFRYAVRSALRRQAYPLPTAVAERRYPYPEEVLLRPEYGARLLVADTDAAEAELLSTTLAIHAYRRTHGKWPSGIEELVRRGYLQRVPQDPFNRNVVGQTTRLRYRAVSGEPVVYSVGPDGKDDGGVALYTDSAFVNGGTSRLLTSYSKGDLVAGATVGW